MKRKVAILLACLFVISGCGYSFYGSGENIDPSIQSVSVGNFINTSNEANIEVLMRNAMIERVIRGGRLTIVASEKDADAVAFILDSNYPDQQGPVNVRLPLTDEQTLDPDFVTAVFELCDGIDQAAMPPLEHAAAGQEPVAHPEFYFAAVFFDQAFVTLGNIIPYVDESLGTGFQRACNAPVDDPVTGINAGYNTAMGHRAAARHAHGAADHDVIFLYSQVFYKGRVIRKDGFPGAWFIVK